MRRTPSLSVLIQRDSYSPYGLTQFYHQFYKESWCTYRNRMLWLREIKKSMYQTPVTLSRLFLAGHNDIEESFEVQLHFIMSSLVLPPLRELRVGIKKAAPLYTFMETVFAGLVQRYHQHFYNCIRKGLRLFFQKDSKKQWEKYRSQLLLQSHDLDNA